MRPERLSVCERCKWPEKVRNLRFIDAYTNDWRVEVLDDQSAEKGVSKSLGARYPVDWPRCHFQPAEGMVLRRSKDHGETWGPRIPTTPNTGIQHAANNACLRRLSTGRLLLSCRKYVKEMVGTVRWLYCVYSDDDGKTWQTGRHVPDPGLDDELKAGKTSTSRAWPRSGMDAC